MITFRRLYHVSSTAYSLKKLGVKLNKMVNPKVNRQWYPTRLETDIMPSVKSLTKTQNEPGKRAIRRSSMLNKLFMKYITDIMSTGTVAIDIVGRGIEVSKDVFKLLHWNRHSININGEYITHLRFADNIVIMAESLEHLVTMLRDLNIVSQPVKITSDLQKVLVFWVCKGDSSDKETEAVLNRIAGALRHELSTLRVMGEVPYIEFVKDHQEAQLVDLDRRLRIADYGEDYTPTDMGHLLKTDFTLNTKISPEMKAKIKQLEAEIPFIEEPLPEMTQNVYGLDHEKILNRLMASRKKSRDAWRRLDDSTDTAVISYRKAEDRTSDVDLGSQKKELAEFLLKRKDYMNHLDTSHLHRFLATEVPEESATNWAWLFFW